jgi:hypothetical protein
MQRDMLHAAFAGSKVGKFIHYAKGPNVGAVREPPLLLDGRACRGTMHRAPTALVKDFSFLQTYFY